jgi:hypothetical protein
MVMSNKSAAQQRTNPAASPVRSRLAALRQAFVAHTLKRAIADVAATSESDFRDFGIDKGELLDGLARLREVVRSDAPAAAAAGRAGADGLSVMVVRHLGVRGGGSAVPRQVVPA